MAVKISQAAAIAACKTINDLIDGGSGAGKLNIYGGTRPTDVNTAIGAQPLLVSFTLADPAFGNPVNTGSNATATANAITPVQAAATGTATWFRVFDSANVAIFDGDVTDTAGSGDLKVSTTSILINIDVTVVSLTTNMPKG